MDKLSRPFSVLRTQADLRTKVFRDQILKAAGFKIEKLDATKYYQQDEDEGEMFQIKMFFCKEGETKDEASYYMQIKISRALTDEDLKNKKLLRHRCDSEEGWYVIHLYMENLSCLSHNEIQNMCAPVKMVQLHDMYQQKTASI
ncbi:MAG: hypothetical protein EOP45_22920 [Sphingobacteriaceae bacterium]|nr:MAG: hypothetical protein EOP45_22920 [Sphingobacteriaceae bacterium]